MRWKLPATLLSALVMSSSMAWGADLSQVRSLVEQGRTREALSDLDRHLAKHPVDPEAMFLRGFVLTEIQREKEARQAFEEVSDLRPDRPEPLNNLAVIQAAAGDYDGAVETLKEALRTHPAYRTAYENLTKIYGQLASEAYSRALRVDGAHDRSALELVLLSDMVLETSAPMLVAEVSERAQPAPTSAATRAAAEKSPAPAVPSSAPAGTPDEAIEAAVLRSREAADASAASTAPAGRSESPSDASGPSELATVVESWAQAWSEQRVDDYLGFYGSDFEPTGDLGREQWQQQRRERLAAPRYVKVTVAFLDFERPSSDRALVRFNQSYESDTFSDVVTKTLELVRREGAWKIVRETVDS
jgi:tetratricopeptide (TPR) repeat protein